MCGAGRLFRLGGVAGALRLELGDEAAAERQRVDRCLALVLVVLEVAAARQHEPALLPPARHPPLLGQEARLDVALLVVGAKRGGAELVLERAACSLGRHREERGRRATAILRAVLTRLLPGAAQRRRAAARRRCCNIDGRRWLAGMRLMPTGRGGGCSSGRRAAGRVPTSDCSDVDRRHRSAPVRGLCALGHHESAAVGLERSLELHDSLSQRAGRGARRRREEALESGLVRRHEHLQVA